MPDMALEVIPEDVKVRLASGEPLAVLDVREHDEVTTWPFPGSIHIPLKQVLEGQLPGVLGDRPLITLCHSGNRSLVAAQVLRRRGLVAQSMRGGIAAWSRLYDVASISLGDRAEVLQFRRLGKGCLSYLVVAGGEAAVIDPSWQTSQYVEAAAARGAAIRAVIDTHLHADHVSGGRGLAEATGAPLYLNPADPFTYDQFTAVGEGFTIGVGLLPMTAMATPGHTAGSVVWRLGDDALVTGDVLFLESIGRPDLHGKAEAFARDLYRTLKRLAALPQDLAILPGHFPEDTRLIFGLPHTDRLGPVRARLRFDAEDEETFVARTSRVPERPPNMAAILEINRYGTPVRPEEVAVLEEGPNRCAVKAGEV